VVDLLEQSVAIPLDGLELQAEIAVPAPARGTVLFAHGSGSSRHSPRNRYVASVLQGVGLATVLVDLLTSEEERVDMVTGQYRFDVSLLATRLVALTDWLAEHDPVDGLAIGLFGASTGAAAALMAAAARPETVGAVVSRGGRPDLAGPALGSVRQPTLLIVGQRDPVVVELNRQAMQQIPGQVRLEIVPGATHLFEEPGALERVAALTADWFDHYLAV
jgi:pimeloyl-ACP methyl ester carboxylesterase